MELHLKIIGFMFVLLALLHMFFPCYFKWKEDLQPLSLINRQMMYIHMFFIALSVLLVGLLCLTAANELTHTRLGARVCFGLFVFCALRLLLQFFGYSPKLWKGKRTETIIHILFSFLWSYTSAVFFISWWSNTAL